MSILSSKEKMTKKIEDKAMAKSKTKVDDDAVLENLAGKSYSTLDLAEILSELFRMRDQFHLWHFQTKSYEIHLALDGFYKGVISFTDVFLEAAMAAGRVPSALPEIHFVDWNGYQVVLDHLEDRKAYWINKKKLLDDRPDLANEIDGFILLINTTMYKLTLK